MTNNANFHVAAFSQTTGAAIVNVALNAVQDQMLTLATATTFLTPDKATVVAAFSTGVTLTRSRLNTPSLRQIGLPSLTPINVGATVPSPANVFGAIDNPIDIPPVDPFGVDAVDTAIDTATVLLWLQYRYQNVPAGKRYRLRFTSTITGVINAWAFGAITMDTVLPQGQYAVIGMDVVAANVLAARLIFADGGPRPGCLARNTVGAIMNMIFTNGSFGQWGTFNNANMPQLEILLGAGGASAAQEGFLDVVRLGDAPR
jgi:hypothetical protein